MRRVLPWPALSYHFGLKPIDVEWLTYGEIDQYLKALREINEAQTRR